MTIVRIITVLTSILTLSAASKPVGIVTLDGNACTENYLCMTKCFDIFTITFNRPIYLQSLGIMGGLKETTNQAENNCYFKPKVTYTETEQDISSNRISGTTVASILKPANKIELKSQCSNRVTCVFTVETSDVATWPGLQFQELCEPGKKLQDLDCVLCPSGTFSDQLQATECTECPGGSSSLEGATECTYAS